ncbi:MAG TPA: GNAT family N-acetyltransferase [Thermoanaerobaculia bacterium]|nr:GNAT family N-acetyltransferase [Thermoanaerobaculia bacterium]
MPFGLSFEPLAGGSGLSAARVPWDSELLGFSVIEMRAGGVHPELAGRALRDWLAREASHPLLLVLRTDPADVALGETLARIGFYPAELSYELSIPLRRLGSVAAHGRPGARLRPAEPRDLPALDEIARSAFRADRFHRDPHVPGTGADGRYASWIAEGMTAGEPICVYENERTSETMGFFHLRETGARSIDIRLAAMHPRFQGTGLGAVMYEAVLSEWRDRGFDSATTRISASNLEVVNVFARLGFTFCRAQLTWHLWRS